MVQGSRVFFMPTKKKSKKGRPRLWFKREKKVVSPSRRQTKPWCTVMLPLEAYAMLTELSEFHMVSRSTIAHRLIYAEFLRTLSRVDPEKAKEMEKEFEARFHNPVIERVE